MGKIVYILGAGFSAALGLPVMSNFLEKSRDQYDADPHAFGHFQNVFTTIKELHVTKSYYKTDLSNIEEILSILEMREQLGTQTTDSQFRKYIADVIRYHTPPIETSRSEWQYKLFGSEPWMGYAEFVAGLLGLNFVQTPEHSGNFIVEELPTRLNQYSIVTLNYDLVLETIANFFKKHYKVTRSFTKNQADVDHKDWIPLAKLHGSIDTDTIIPPTWNKNLNDKEIFSSWNLAFHCIADANYIRIIGYSLSQTDSYIKYLLRAAVIDSPNLKQIDVWCLDPEGLVKKRYDEFIEFNNYAFRQSSFAEYLSDCAYYPTSPPRETRPDKIEDFHKKHFGRD